MVNATAVDPPPRMYRSNLELRPHTDITAMIALAGWHKSESAVWSRRHRRAVGHTARSGAKIRGDIVRAAKTSDLAKRMIDMGMEPAGSAPEQYDALIRSEIEKWGPVVRCPARRLTDGDGCCAKIG